MAMTQFPRLLLTFQLVFLLLTLGQFIYFMYNIYQSEIQGVYLPSYTYTKTRINTLNGILFDVLPLLFMSIRQGLVSSAPVWFIFIFYYQLLGHPTNKHA